MITFRLSKASFVLMVLPFAALLNDAFTFKLGSIFVTPYKLALLLSVVFLFESFLFFYKKKQKYLSSISVFFIGYCLLILISVFYSGALAISQKINYFLFISSEIIIIIGLTYKLQNVNISRIINSFIKIVLVIFFSSLVLSTAQLIFKDQIIYTGLFASRKIIYAITGFNIERLFLSEFLTFGLAMIMFTNKYSKKSRLILFIWVGFLIVYSGSFTGILGFLGLTMILIKRINFKSFLFLLIIIIPFFLFNKIDLGESINSKLSFNEAKFESYYTNASEENWRFISSLALIKEVISNPTIFGHGFLSNAIFLKDVNYFYSISKYGKSKATDKENTSHTFVSVIYDQGILGLVVLLTFLIKLLILVLKLYRNRMYNLGTNYNLILKITLILSILVLLRFTFYYHSINHWHYLILVVFSNILLLSKKNMTITK